MTRRGGNILKKCLVISSLLIFEVVHLFGGGQTNKHQKKKCFADAIPFPISLHFFQDGYALAAAMQKLRAKLRNTMIASIKTLTKQCDASVFGFNLLWQRNVQYNNISMMELYDKAAGK
jgi:hypothetical protein